MYRKILVTLDHSKTDQALIDHISDLAKITLSELVLIHVADGWVARNFDKLKLTESEEMRDDRAYLDDIAEKFRKNNLQVSIVLALGDPPTEILKSAEKEKCDLIAMTSHGHRLIGDIVLGSTIETVRHKTHIPLLIVRGTTQ
jgi:nucleotide-binding universal stress UspA family protein